jgi:hypothetical protein
MFHPVYSKEDLEDVKVVRRPLITRSDKIAGKLVKWLRFVFSSVLSSLLLLLTLWLSRRAGFDIVSRYKHRELPANPEKYSVESLRRMGCIMSPDQWLMRILFLEVIAGIPVRSLLALSSLLGISMADKCEIRAVQGMVAGTLRQFVSYPRVPQTKTLMTPALFGIYPYSLHSLRLMKRDGGWIHSLLEEVRPSSSFRTVRIPS